MIRLPMHSFNAVIISLLLQFNYVFFENIPLKSFSTSFLNNDYELMLSPLILSCFISHNKTLEQ